MKKILLSVFLFCLTAATRWIAFAEQEGTQGHQKIQQEYAGWTRIVQDKGEGLLRETGVSAGDDLPRCREFKFPPRLSVGERTYQTTNETCRLRFGDDLLLASPMEFRLLDKTNGVPFLVAEGKILVFKDSRNARVVPIGSCALDSSAPVSLLARGLSVETFGEAIYWETRWRRFGSWRRGAVCRNVVVAIESGDGAKEIALALVKACCPGCDMGPVAGAGKGWAL